MLSQQSFYIQIQCKLKRLEWDEQNAAFFSWSTFSCLKNVHELPLTAYRMPMNFTYLVLFSTQTYSSPNKPPAANGDFHTGKVLIKGCFIHQIKNYDVH